MVEIRADGVATLTIVEAILDIMPLDYSTDQYPAYFCRKLEKYEDLLVDNQSFANIGVELSHAEFIEETKAAFAVVHTRDNIPDGAVILRKGKVSAMPDIAEEEERQVPTNEVTPMRHTQLKDYEPSLNNMYPCIVPKLLKSLASIGQGGQILFINEDQSVDRIRRNVFDFHGIPKVTMIKAIVDLMPLEDSPDETSVYFVYGESDKNKPSYEELKNKYGSIPRDGELDFLSNYKQLKINDFERKAAEAFIVIYIRDDNKQYGSVILQKGRVRDIHHTGEVMTA